jgi:hypothetical protein
MMQVTRPASSSSCSTVHCVLLSHLIKRDCDDSNRMIGANCRCSAGLLLINLAVLLCLVPTFADAAVDVTVLQLEGAGSPTGESPPHLTVADRWLLER